MRIAIVGCGLIGSKRLRSLNAEHRVVAVADLDHERARALAQQRDGVTVAHDWREIMRRDDVDAVIVATTNDSLASVTIAAASAGKHVLVEKPAARTVTELDAVISAAESSEVVVQVGFNHRFHPALRKAREIYESGMMGTLMFIRGRYGHGGRVGYEKEWRASKAIAGGGELIDQGVHLLDLARWFLGDFAEVTGSAHTFFWPMEVEDNAFVSARTAAGQIAWLHVSCTEWKNLFSLEIYGRDGKLHIEGLGGSYGVERLTYYQMLPQMGPPQTQTWEYPGEDISWKLEFESFAEAVRTGGKPAATLTEARAALSAVEEIYRLSKTNAQFVQAATS